MSVEFYFSFFVCLMFESTVLKLHPSAEAEETSGCLCVSVYACCYERSEKSSAVSKVQSLDENMGVHHKILKSRILAWWAIQPARRKREARGWRETEGGREKGLQRLCHASVCHSPLRFPMDMNEVNEWWTQHTETPLFYWGRSSPFMRMSEASTTTTAT